MYNFSELLKNRLVQCLACFAAGALTFTLIAPSKITETKLKQEYEAKLSKQSEQYKTTIANLESEKTQLRQENLDIETQYSKTISAIKSQYSDRSTSKVTTYHKVTRPDGSSEEWKTTEYADKSSQRLISEIQGSYDNKVKILEQKYQADNEKVKQSTEEKYASIINELKTELSKKTESTTVTVNPKKLGVEAGFTTDQTFYGHGTYNFWGPFFFGSHIESNLRQHSAGIGLGINF